MLGVSEEHPRTVRALVALDYARSASDLVDSANGVLPGSDIRGDGNGDTGFRHQLAGYQFVATVGDALTRVDYDDPHPLKLPDDANAPAGD